VQLVKTNINHGQGLSKTEFKVNSRGHGLVALVMSLWMHFTALTAAQEAEEYQGDDGSEDKEKEEEEEEEGEEEGGEEKEEEEEEEEEEEDEAMQRAIVGIRSKASRTVATLADDLRVLTKIQNYSGRLTAVRGRMLAQQEANSKLKIDVARLKAQIRSLRAAANKPVEVQVVNKLVRKQDAPWTVTGRAKDGLPEGDSLAYK
jgi:hypothetical protein